MALRGGCDLILCLWSKSVFLCYFELHQSHCLVAYLQQWPSGQTKRSPVSNNGSISGTRVLVDHITASNYFSTINKLNSDNDNLYIASNTEFYPDRSS